MTPYQKQIIKQIKKGNTFLQALAIVNQPTIRITPRQPNRKALTM